MDFQLKRPLPVILCVALGDIFLMIFPAFPDLLLCPKWLRGGANSYALAQYVVNQELNNANGEN